MGANRRRQKRRTDVRPADNAADDAKDKKKSAPKSFVVHSGDISKHGGQLVQDLRRVMEPNTATRLHERRHNKIRDYLAMAGPLSVSHICLVSETESGMNLRIGRFPRGPTLYFRVLEYALAGDVRAAAKRPRSPGHEFSTPPLLVLSKFDVDAREEHRLLTTVLQHYYPTFNASKVRLVDLRRTVLYEYDQHNDAIIFRHFLIRVRERGLTRLSKTLGAGRLPSNLGEFGDVGDFVARAMGAASDSEPDDGCDVTLGQDYLGSANVKSARRAVTLTEIGPRLTLRLVKISDGLNEGRVLYHVPAEDAERASE